MPGTEYTGRMVIGPSATSGQNLKFYVAGSGALLDTDVIDDDWDTGYVGLFRAAGREYLQCKARCASAG